MRVIDAVAAMRQVRNGCAGSVSLVPTMGGLHRGHEELIRRARRAGETLVVSLFVNPKQFGSADDLEAYPRDLEDDARICRRHDVDVLFAPSAEEMYPPGEDFVVDPGPIGRLLEGAQRPGHFVGVATVVAKLFDIIRPHLAFFGEKDAQQLAVIRSLVTQLGLDVQIIPVPTVREPDGLAVSTRNAYLTGPERRAAGVLYLALVAAGEAWRSGERNGARLRARMSDVLAREPLADPEYVSIADPETLLELEQAGPVAFASMAVRIGRARLIDNVLLRQEDVDLPQSAVSSHDAEHSA